MRPSATDTGPASGTGEPGDGGQIPPEAPPAPGNQTPAWLQSLIDALTAAANARLAEIADAANAAPGLDAPNPAGTEGPDVLEPADAPPEPLVVSSLDALTCNPLGFGDAAASGGGSCAVPWPSDLFRTAAGVLEVPDSILDPATVAEYPASIAPSNVLNGSDGYPALSPVLFELDQPIDPATVPADGGSAFAVYDTSTGARVPIIVDLDPDAAVRGAPNTIIRAWPWVRFEFGHAYVAVITDSLGSAGTPFARTPGVDEALGGSGTPLGDARRAGTGSAHDRHHDTRRLDAERSGLHGDR